MAQIVRFPIDRTARAGARAMIVGTDMAQPVDVAQVLRRLEAAIRAKQRAASGPAPIINFELHRGSYRAARGT